MDPLLHRHHDAVLRRLLERGAVTAADAHAAEAEAARAGARGTRVTPLDLLLERGALSRATVQALALGEERRQRQSRWIGLGFVFSAVCVLAVVLGARAVLARKAVVERAAAAAAAPRHSPLAAELPAPESRPPVRVADPAPVAPDPSAAAVPDPDAAHRERVHREAVAEEEYRREQERAEAARLERLRAATAHRDRLLAELEALPACAAFEDLRRRKTEFDARRAAALEAICDSATYTYDQAKGDHGDAAQPEVDRRVAAVRSAWRLRHDRPVRFEAALRPRIEAGRDAERDVIAAGGTAARDLADHELRLAACDAPLDLANVWLTPHERDRLTWNAAVRAFNREAHEDLHPTERKHVELVNEYREMLGLHMLEIHPALCRSARRHSEWMLAAQRLSHEEDNDEGRTLTRRVGREEYPGAAGENVAFGPPDPQSAFQAWYTSSDHHRNMVDAVYNQIGVGKAKLYWTQNFGRAAPQVK